MPSNDDNDPAVTPLGIELDTTNASMNQRILDPPSAVNAFL